MINDLYNNFSIASLGILFVLNHCEKLSVAQATLIMPFIMHTETVSYLGKQNVKINSFDALIISKPELFTNINKRYYEALPTSINAIQFLLEMEYLKLNGNYLHSVQPIEYDKKMGSRANKIFKMSQNLSKVLQNNDNKLYLNMRIDL